MPIKNITLMEDLLTSHDLENMYIYGTMECSAFCHKYHRVSQYAPLFIVRKLICILDFGKPSLRDIYCLRHARRLARVKEGGRKGEHAFRRRRD